jgi:hypothetical protein
MRIQTKTFYADLFSKSPSTAPAPGADVKPRPTAIKAMAPKMAQGITVIKPMAPLAPALNSKARSPDELPGPAPGNSTAALPVPVSAGAISGNETAKAPAPEATSPVQGRRSALTKLLGALDIHDMSPRQMTHLSQTLYAAGALSFEDYSQLAFQPELHPDYERTIGALTGEHAAPDRRRDFVSLWNERADFQRRHNSGRPDLIEQSERIASVLSRIETPMNVMA